MKNFKDYMTTGREKVLQKADIEGKKMGGPLGSVIRKRAAAIFDRGVNPTPENKKAAARATNLHKLWQFGKNFQNNEKSKNTP